MAQQYEVISNRVEIGGKIREHGAIVDASEFNPDARFFSEKDRHLGAAAKPRLTEIESLIESRHIRPVAG